ncbi:hypothetical protein [Streptomyces sp. CAU 1734]|uniref:hypothetical protein n=1 Tax=Streptomyces sp. CAU 1734 TaxID=3140360 RepID=UPI0032608B2B
MRLRPRRTPAPPGPDHTRIAVLEHDLLGITPPDGSAAALTIALRATGTCLAHDPIATTTLRDPAPTAVCARCGQCMVYRDGTWQTAKAG